MDQQESIDGIGDFEVQDNNVIGVQCVKDWGILSVESDSIRMETENVFISGSDLNLQHAALPEDVSVLNDLSVVLPVVVSGFQETSVNLVDCPSTSENDKGFKDVVNDRHKFKRTNTVLSPDSPELRKQIRLSDSNPIVNMVFIKGKFESIVHINSISLKESILKVDNTLKPEQMKYTKDSLCIKCTNKEQKEKILEIKKLLGIEIVTSVHAALSRQSRDFDSLDRVIIFGVSIEISDDQICQETGSVTAKRLLKKDDVSGTRLPTETVILTFELPAPKSVYIGIKEHKTKTYCPLPIRCFNCQRLGHVQSACRGKTTCPKCAGPHLFSLCPLNPICPQSTSSVTHPPVITPLTTTKCCNCNGPHSAAYWGCPKFQERKKILEIKTLQKIPYGDAVTQYKDSQAHHDHIGNSESANGQEVLEVFEVNRTNQSSSIQGVQQNLNSQLSKQTYQDSTIPKEGPNLDNSMDAPMRSMNNFVVSTPWKNKNSQTITTQRTQDNLSTVLEEEDFPLLGASKPKDIKVLDILLDKFLKFMVNLFLDLLPMDCVLARFKSFAESLSLTELQNTGGRFFL